MKVPDEDHEITVIYPARIQHGRVGEALDDSDLLSICEQSGDSEGNLRFALETTSFPLSSAVQPSSPPPPEPSVSVAVPRLRPGEVQGRDHSFDGLGGYEASDESSSRRSGMLPGTRAAAFPLKLLILENFHI